MGFGFIIHEKIKNAMGKTPVLIVIQGFFKNLVTIQNRIRNPRCGSLMWLLAK
jgi:hypothetical protein